MINSFDPSGACWTRGQRFEDLARSAFVERGHRIRRSTKEEDIKLHADFWAYSSAWGRWVTVDAKAMKRVSRSGVLQDEFAYVEWRNTVGRAGWLIAGADVLCFERRTDMIVVARSVVLDVATSLVDRSRRVNNPSDALYASYTRNERDDEISMIRLTDIPRDKVRLWGK